MDGLRVFLVLLLGAVSYSQDWISGSVLEMSVRPGDNITLYCDCKLSARAFIVWYRNCSHENQPPLVLKSKREIPWRDFSGDNIDPLKIFPRFQFVRNSSSNSYDLLIINITDLDEGLYYCGNEDRIVEDKEYITARNVYRYSNITTRIKLDSSQPDSSQFISSPVCVQFWMMVFTPAFTILSTFLAFILVYHFRDKTDEKPQILQNQPDTKPQTRQNQDEDLYLTRVVFRVRDGQTHQ